MNAFRFSPELFEHRAEALEGLDEAGYVWLTNYSSVDCLHDVYGLEVCGIHERQDSVGIFKALKKLFPDWSAEQPFYVEYGANEGWKVRIRRDGSSQGGRQEGTY
jgi:hypothetical protein